MPLKKKVNVARRKPAVTKRVTVVKAKTKTKPRTKRYSYNSDMSRLGFGDIGASLGRSAGDFISRITGMGDYKVNSNTLVNAGGVPTFQSRVDGVEICHREFLTDIVGSTIFNNIAASINPGSQTLFPWLSTLAANFEEYDMRGLVFEFKPSSGSAISSASSALGVVIYATDYNVLTQPFTNKQIMESYEFSTSTVPFQPMIHPIECASRSNPIRTFYVRTANVPSGADARLYDMGTFQFATQGMQSSYVVGELWVSYHILLKKPRINPNTSNEYAHLTEFPRNGATAAAIFGSSGASLTSLSNLAGILASPTTPTTSIIIENPGYYLINLTFVGNSATSIITSACGSNITFGAVNCLRNTNNSISFFNSTSATWEQIVYVSLAGSGVANTITFTGPTGATSGTSDLFIIPMPTYIN